MFPDHRNSFLSQASKSGHVPASSHRKVEYNAQEEANVLEHTLRLNYRFVKEESCSETYTLRKRRYKVPKKKGSAIQSYFSGPGVLSDKPMHSSHHLMHERAGLLQSTLMSHAIFGISRSFSSAGELATILNHYDLLEPLIMYMCWGA